MRKVWIAAGLAAVALAGCSSSNKVGSGVDLNVKNAAGQGAIRGSTTPTAPVATPVPHQTGAVGKTTTTTPTTTITTAPPTTQQVAPLDIDVNRVSAGTSQFDPSQARVYTGS